MADLFTAIVEGFRAALRREELPPSSPGARPTASGPSLLQAVFAREPLGHDAPAAVTPRRGFFSLLLGREPLGHGAPPPPRHRTHWLTWLFRPEHLDD